MLTARVAALGAWRALRACGNAPVLGADPSEVAAGRLALARQAARVIMRARGTERSGMTEPTDERLEEMLLEVRAAAAAYETAARGYVVRGGPASDVY